MGKVILVNVAQGEESRIAIIDGGNLDNYYTERAGHEQIVGNIYKAKVVAVEQSLQAAFVNFGGQRQGFLHLSDVCSKWYQDKRMARRRDKSDMSIGRVLKEGQEIIVQVTKEGIRNKAPAVTTFLSLPGRYLVLMPQIKRHGVSRKIADEDERQEVRKVLEALNPPEDTGVIVRTAAAGKGRREIQKDLNYLLRLWVGIQKRAKRASGPTLLYEERDLVIRVVRDVFSSQIEKIYVDSKEVYERIREFMKLTMPSSRKVVQLYKDSLPLFTRYHVEDQIAVIHRNRVPLEGGGSVVIEQTEALVAIDVNSGRFKREANAEDTAFRINMAAAPVIGRQIRLRDLGGLIICDFIDMRDENHKRQVERALWQTLKGDRARAKMLRMSRFGIIEMTRQRTRRNVEFTDYKTCPVCKGKGLIRNPESAILETLRRIRGHVAEGKWKRVEVRMHPDMLIRFQNERREEIVDLERTWGGRVVLAPSDDGIIDNVDVKCYKN